MLSLKKNSISRLLWIIRGNDRLYHYVSIFRPLQITDSCNNICQFLQMPNLSALTLDHGGPKWVWIQFVYAPTDMFRISASNSSKSYSCRRLKSLNAFWYLLRVVLCNLPTPIRFLRSSQTFTKVCMPRSVLCRSGGSWNQSSLRRSSPWRFVSG